MQRLKVGDLVQVIAGRDKGKQGRITRLMLDKDRVVIEGINMVTRHQKPNNREPQGGRIRKEAPIHISNVMPINVDSGKPTRVKFLKNESGEKKRVSRRGAELKTG
jgi:large subunit ribosomal protein L24